MSALTDVGIGYNAQRLEELIGGRFTDRSASTTDRWKSGYDLTQRSNHAIAQIQQMELDDEKKNLFIGEAKFLRALMRTYQP